MGNKGWRVISEWYRKILGQKVLAISIPAIAAIFGFTIWVYVVGSKYPNLAVTELKVDRAKTQTLYSADWGTPHTASWPPVR